MDLNKFTTSKNLVYTRLRSRIYNHCGDDSVGDPPVLIPNTEVKPDCADGTYPDTGWKTMELPHFIKRDCLLAVSFFFLSVAFTQIICHDS